MKRSKFSLSHYKLLTCKMGQLIPVTWFEVLPGDTVQQATAALVRCAPLVTPVMHPVSVRFHHWFVPNRLLWSSWENFITGGADGLNASQAPYINLAANAAVGSLADYLGLPTAGLAAAVNVSALPFRAYQKIWNEFYRDEDLQTAVTVSTGDGSDTTTATALQNCDWEKDYFTSSRPWAQKGAAVTMPVGGQAPVKTSATDTVTGAQQGLRWLADTGATPTQTSYFSTGGGANAVRTYLAGTSTPAGNSVYPSNLYADLANATAVDINTVRHAFALQRFEEARARYGSRYTEYLRYLGVRSSDARLQRPEYLGGGKQTIQFSEVLQTGVTTSGTGTGVGNMFGHGISAMRTNRYRRFFEEHGIVMTLMSARPRTMYTQNVDRSWLRGISSTYVGTLGSKEDYWQRELQHIGQQQINGLEVDSQVGALTAFGFQDRYDEYRRRESSIAGLFRTTLDTWHLGRKFASAPALNSTFVNCVPATRTFQDTTADNLYVMANHSIQARRLVSREGTSSVS